jgi:hypothetical protein
MKIARGRNYVEKGKIDKLNITNTAEWNAAIAAIKAAPNGSQILDIADPGTGIGVAGATANTFGTTSAGNTLTVTLQGTGKLYLTSQSAMLRIGANQELIIGSANLTLEGLKNGQNGSAQDNNDSLVYITAGGTAKLKNGTITGNATLFGGGVYVDSGTLTVSGGKITGNTANSGGGICVNYGTLIMNGGVISDNTATGTDGNGGGVYMNYGTFTMSVGIISGNKADNGSGVYLLNGGKFNMDSGEITDNDATSGNGSGGGVCMVGSGAEFTMSDGTISKNKAKNGGGVYLVASGKLNMNGGKITENDATSGNGSGGGVCIVDTGSEFIMSDGIISKNNANNGGGVYLIANGKFNMEGGEITGNTASGNGGGVCLVDNGTSFTMSTGGISGNKCTGASSFGGGVYVFGGTFRIVTGTIYGTNEADTALRNTATNASALNNAGTAQYGTFSGSTWNSNGTLVTTDSTVKCANGVLQP